LLCFSKAIKEQIHIGEMRMSKATKKSAAQAIETSAKKAASKKVHNKISKSRVACVGLKKTYLKSSGCRVTFVLPKEAAPEAEKVTIVGDFNNWNYAETEMKKLRSGDFKLTLKLSPDREYKFRYLIDSRKWENDWCADKYIPNPFGGDDSVVVI